MPDQESSRRADLADAILAASASLLIVLDGDGRVVRLNRACERLTGFTTDELRGKSAWPVLLSPEEAEGTQTAFNRVIQGDPPEFHEVRMSTRDGSERRVAWCAEPVLDGGDRVVWVIATGVDVTEHRRIEEELTQFRLGIERSGEIIFLTDREGRIRYVNPAFEQVYGYGREEVLGRTPRILKSGIHGAEVYEKLWSSLLAREVVSGELVNRAKDGRLLTISASANPVLDAEGRITGFLAIQRDITAWKQAEHARTASEERLRTVLEKTPDGVGVVDTEGRILYANPAIGVMLGYTNEELVGRRVSDFQHPDDRSRAAARFGELFRGGPEDPSQYRLIRKDGGLVTAEITSRVIEYEGRPALLSTMRDLTERLELEEQLRQAQKMEAIGQLAGGIAHDFNNLLTVIQVSAELIGDGLDGADPTTNQNLNELQSAVSRGKDLIAKLVAFSRGEELRLEPLDLPGLILDFKPTLRRLVPEHIEIRFSLPGDLPPVLASRGSVEQIIMNLATNAANSMPEGGLLKIAAAPTRMAAADPFSGGKTAPGRFVRLSVSDTGMGMDESTRARVFEPFFTTRRTSGGVGLGMAVVYGLVKQLGGHVQVSSELGRGSAVQVDLPVAAIDALPPIPDVSAEVQRGTETILVAEDEAALRRAAQRSLERLGYRVLLAADGEEALTVFDSNAEDIDLIVTDMVMPRRGGRALYAALRDRGVRVPVLFTSGYSAGEADQLARVDSGPPFIAKPWTLDELARKIREVLDGDSRP